MIDKINDLLRDEAQTGTLDEVGPETLEATASLFGVLDREEPTPGVRRTKLAWALHLKWPGLLPLYDSYIWRCHGELGSVQGQDWYLRRCRVQTLPYAHAFPCPQPRITQLWRS